APACSGNQRFVAHNQMGQQLAQLYIIRVGEIIEPCSSSYCSYTSSLQTISAVVPYSTIFDSSLKLLCSKICANVPSSFNSASFSLRSSTCSSLLGCNVTVPRLRTPLIGGCSKCSTNSRFSSPADSNAILIVISVPVVASARPDSTAEKVAGISDTVSICPSSTPSD